MEELERVVREVAGANGFLDGEGRLLELDSISAIDFVVALESALSRRIDFTLLRTEFFVSIESVVQMLRELPVEPSA